MKISDFEKTKIKSLYGLIKEQSQSSKFKPCKDCVKNYSGLLDFCGFRAIERYEENYGTAYKTGLGDDYFENQNGGYKIFDERIKSRIFDTVGQDTWNKMGPKFRMQLWSFMYNSDSGVSDKYRWLALLYLTASQESFDEKKTLGIIDKKDNNYWNNAIEVVKNFSDWDSNLIKFEKMVVGQLGTYSTELAKIAMKNGWPTRPSDLDEMYDECIKNNEQQSIKNQSIKLKNGLENSKPTQQPDKTLQKDLDKITPIENNSVSLYVNNLNSFKQFLTKKYKYLSQEDFISAKVNKGIYSFMGAEFKFNNGNFEFYER